MLGSGEAILNHDRRDHMQLACDELPCRWVESVQGVADGVKDPSGLSELVVRGLPRDFFASVLGCRRCGLSKFAPSAGRRWNDRWHLGNHGVGFRRRQIVSAAFGHFLHLGRPKGGDSGCDFIRIVSVGLGG